MSFVISSSQQLASSDKYTSVRHIEYDVPGTEIKRYGTGFGQNLYSFVSDILSIECVSGKGCTFPVMPSCGITFAFLEKGEEHESYVCGATREIRKINMQKGDMLLLFHFLPGAAAPLLKCDANEITDRYAKAEEISLGGAQIHSCFGKAISMNEKVKLISSMMRTRILRSDDNQLIRYCFERMRDTCGNVRVDELAFETQFSARYIDKLFGRFIGLSPKSCAGIIKLLESISKALENRDELLTNIAAECGYFDHAHMNRACRKMLHCSSGEIRANMFKNLDYSKVDFFIPALSGANMKKR